jgi:hypothetical protein
MSIFEAVLFGDGRLAGDGRCQGDDAWLPPAHCLDDAAITGVEPIEAVVLHA